MAVKEKNKSGAVVAEQFYRSARKSCPSAYRKKLKSSLTAGLTDYIEANPDADMAAIVEHFGKPEDFAHEFINEMTADEKQHMLKRSKIVKWCALAVSITLILSIIAVAISIIIEDQKSEAYYYRYEISVEEGE